MASRALVSSVSNAFTLQRSSFSCSCRHSWQQQACGVTAPYSLSGYQAVLPNDHALAVHANAFIFQW
jgi:hypothetical protein